MKKQTQHQRRGGRGGRGGRGDCGGAFVTGFEGTFRLMVVVVVVLSFLGTVFYFVAFVEY